MTTMTDETRTTTVPILKITKTVRTMRLVDLDTDTYASAFPLLDDAEQETLEQEIRRAEGILTGVIVDEHGRVLDGADKVMTAQLLAATDPDLRDRLLDMAVTVLLTDHMTEQDKQDFAVRQYLARHHATPQEKARLLLRQSEGGLGDREVGRLTGVDGKTVGKIRAEMIASAEISADAPRIVKRQGNQRYPMKVVTTTLRNAPRAIRNMQQAGEHLPDRHIVTCTQSAKYAGIAIREHYKQDEDTAPIQDIDIHLADFRTFAWPKGARLVLTDPLYDWSHVDDYLNCARIASEVLRPDGWLAVCAGSHFNFEIQDRLRKHMKKLVTVSIQIKDAPSLCRHCQQVSSHNMPALSRLLNDGIIDTRYEVHVYGMPEARPEFRKGLLTGFTSGGTTRARYAMEKSVDDMAYFIERLTRPGDLVFDFCAGSAPVMEACYRHKRRYIGTENDPEAIKTAYRRKADMLQIKHSG